MSNFSGERAGKGDTSQNFKDSRQRNLKDLLRQGHEWIHFIYSLTHLYPLSLIERGQIAMVIQQPGSPRRHDSVSDDKVDVRIKRDPAALELGYDGPR
jgi:hypothetical protein